MTAATRATAATAKAILDPRSQAGACRSGGRIVVVVEDFRRRIAGRIWHRGRVLHLGEQVLRQTLQALAQVLGGIACRRASGPRFSRTQSTMRGWASTQMLRPGLEACG